VRARLIRRLGPVQALDLGKCRRVLRAAHRLVSATLAEPRRHPLHHAAARLAEWLALAARALKRSLVGLLRRSRRA
jgi:hypothetical protein